eukprot:IDg19700t1
MIGYAANQKGYKLRNANKGEVVVSIDVLFDEQSSTHAIIVDPRSQDAESEPNEDPSADYGLTPDENVVERIQRTGFWL